MLHSRIAVVVPLVAILWGCVEQEPFRPSEDDKKVIKEHILTKAPDNLKFKVNADLEGDVIYLGLDVDKDVIKPGEQFKLTHYWKCNKEMAGWKMFVHLNGPEKRGFINADHIPIGGRHPVARWKPGQVIRDVHSQTLPNNWKDDKVMVMVGLWKGNLRKKIKGPQDEESRVLAATIKVEVSDAVKKASEPPTLVAVRTGAGEPVKVDGVLDEAVWGRAKATGAFVETMSGGEAAVKTTAKFAYDDKNLYVAFESDDEDVWTSLKERDDKLWTQEAVELFIDANGDGKDYVELQVNPAGAIFDSYLPAYRKNDNAWNSNLKAAVKVEGTLNKREDKDKGWVVEISIPWADTKGRGEYEMTLPPALGQSFKINMFRLDMPQKKPQRAAAWSAPLVGDFHKLDRFGTLVFGDEEGKAPEAKKEEPAKEEPAKEEPAKEEPAREEPAKEEAKIEQPAQEALPPGVIRMKPVDTESIRARVTPRMVALPPGTKPTKPSAK